MKKKHETIGALRHVDLLILFGERMVLRAAVSAGTEVLAIPKVLDEHVSSREHDKRQKCGLKRPPSGRGQPLHDLRAGAGCKHKGQQA